MYFRSDLIVLRRKESWLETLNYGYRGEKADVEDRKTVPTFSFNRRRCLSKRTK
jgi:hypothetical protein